VEYRTDPLTGRTVVVVGSRQARPNLPPDGCPFCPGGLEAPEPYDVRWFPNRWPPMEEGRCEVVLYTPVHDATFASLGIEGASRVVRLWADRTEALGARPDIAYVLVFENRGPAVGATIAHPHGQIYGFGAVPDAARVELERPDPLGADVPADLLVARRGTWRAWTPAASSYPYELVVAPEDAIADLPSARATATDLATVLVDVLGRLDRLFDAPMPYMLWIHQRPTDGTAWPDTRAHVHIAPAWRAPGTLRFVAAGELGSGVYFNPVVPEAAADALRRS
jgi:UDPglucose--hexose-1-phosphate uridylyltransferase